MDVEGVRADLIAEQTALDVVMADLAPEQWTTQTSSARWSVADQIGHLAYFDRAASLALTNPDSFRESTVELMTAFSETDANGNSVDSDVAVDQVTLADYRAMSPNELLQTWRAARADLAEASSALTGEERIDWYGPSMGSMSFLTARLMEVWAHGQDIVDALRAERPSTDRIRHIVQLGVITHKWSYENRGLVMPKRAVRVALNAPSGDIWYFGPADASDKIVGPAEDFCRVVTQRRHVDDTELIVTGNAARDWMEKAQAFAGPATDGPAKS
jgi:uncharacterized protein (TIGR03084 family)